MKGIGIEPDLARATTTSYQRNWVEPLQSCSFKREVAGTSKIEGADFTDHELDVALRPNNAKPTRPFKPIGGLLRFPTTVPST
jgi:hypothetical protein